MDPARQRVATAHAGVATPGTLCVEPGGSADAEPTPNLSSLAHPRLPSAPTYAIDGALTNGFQALDATGRAWFASVGTVPTQVFPWPEAFDLTGGSAARLALGSWVMGSATGRTHVLGEYSPRHVRRVWARENQRPG